MHSLTLHTLESFFLMIVITETAIIIIQDKVNAPMLTEKHCEMKFWTSGEIETNTWDTSSWQRCYLLFWAQDLVPMLI